MSIVFYEAPMSSATPVAWTLAELDVPHERVRLDLAAGDQRQPEFLKLNPNGKVPTLVVDGTPLFEALAIMTWLGDRFGIEQGLWPAGDTPAHLEALSWPTWAYVSFVSAVQRLGYATSERVEPDLRSEGQAKLARRDIDGLLEVLEGRLAGAPHVLGEAFSLVDVTVASTVWYATMVGVSIDACPKAWLERCLERPQTKRLMEG